MRVTNSFYSKTLIAVLYFSLVILSCKKESTTNAPAQPINPFPANNEINLPTTLTLSWECPSAENGTLTYYVYLDTVANPINLVSLYQTENSFNAKDLMNYKDYYWKIVIKDKNGNKTEGPIWKFKTVAANYPPNQPSNPFPSNNATEILNSMYLTWDCSDPEGDPLTFDVYVGTTTIPTNRVALNQTEKSFELNGMPSGVKIYWKITAKDNNANYIESPIWKFTTQSSTGIAPVADYEATPTFISKGQNVNFTDKSTNYPTEWFWDFGDGNISTEKNPIHCYSETGMFTVSLTVTNGFGNNTKTSHVNYIMVAESDFETGNVTDIEGNTYNTVKIGSQWWMAENLRTTTYNNGKPITLINSDAVWAELAAKNNAGFCWLDYDISNKNIYGALYNWIAVDSGNLAPAGWHVPTDEEWKQLEITLGMTQQQADEISYRGTDQGASLKHTDGWLNDGNGTNMSGFSAIPGGARAPNEVFYPFGESGYWWTATEFNDQEAWCRFLGCWKVQTGRISFNKAGGGISVRCVKD